jgi:hypothetical protein
MTFTKNPEIDLSNMNVVVASLIQYFEESNIYLLHRLDEALLEKGILENDKDIIDLCVITYCFRKLLSKKHITNNIKWSDVKIKIINYLYKIKEAVASGNQEKLREEIKNIEITIEHTDNLFGYFVQNLVSNSRNKIASSAYGYGLSLSKAVKMLSANKEQVMKIIGETKMSDEDDAIETIQKRVDYISKNKSDSI